MSFMDFAALPQFSFRFAGRPSADLLPVWNRKVTTQPAPTGALDTISYSDPATSLEITLRITHYQAEGALDWVIEFENKGQEDTPILEAICALDAYIPIPSLERLHLHTANGSACQMDDFLPFTVELLPGQQKSFTPAGGRSSDGAFPFVNLQRGKGGMILAVGWSGQWLIQASRKEDGLKLSAGMAKTRLVLHPGEAIRTPRILLLPWEGQASDAVVPETGNNRLRRFLLDHILPRLDGQLVTPPIAQCLQGYFYLTGKAGESIEMTALPKVAALGADAYWIDACWYGGQGEWWQEVGSWEINRAKFPNGLRVISDAAHQAGMKFVLWFEPERVRPGSRLHREHPEYLLASEHDPTNLLFNLGDPTARQYITDLISGLIAENGVDIYRQDFNFDPMPYWQAADAPDRTGMSEIRHVEGLYAFWDELLRRHPHLWIDNCASGGRRIDLETLSRSLPLWPSDFSDTIGLRFGPGLHVGDQVINAGLARWLPLFGGGVWNLTPYGTRGQIMGGFTFAFHIEQADYPDEHAETLTNPNDILARGKTLLDASFPMEAARLAIAEQKSVRAFMLGDFYPLLPITASGYDWCAWQLHREDLSSGIALFFRRHNSPFASMEVSLRCIDPSARYLVSLSPDYTEAARVSMTGASLAAMMIAINEKPGSLLLRYSKQA